jgi:hypothetical protein
MVDGQHTLPGKSADGGVRGGPVTLAQTVPLVRADPPKQRRRAAAKVCLAAWPYAEALRQ